MVPDLDLLFRGLVLGLVRLGVVDHLLDLLLGESASGRDRDLLLLARAHVLGRDIEDAVHVDVEGDFDLRDASRSGSDAVKPESADRLVVRRHVALALEHVDVHGGLVVGRGAEDLALSGRNRRIALDQACRDAAERLDAERQRSDVQQNHVVDLSAEHAALDRRAGRNHFVRVDALVGIAVEDAFGHFLHAGHSGHAADEDHFIDLVLAESGVADARFARRNRTFDQRIAELFQLSARQSHLQMERAALVHRDERQIDVRAHAGREFAFRLFAGLFQTLERLRVVAEVDAVLLLELFGEPVHHHAVEVVAAEVGVAVGGLHFEHAVADFEDRDIERAAAEVVDRDGLVFLLVKPVGEGGCGRLVDDPLHIETRDSAGVLGRLSLGVVEVGRNRDDGFGDLFAQIGFRVGFQFLKDHCGDFRRGVGLVAGLDIGVAVLAFHHFIRHAGDFILHFGVFSAHEALDGEDRVLRVRYGLAFCGLTDEPFSCFRKRNNGRSRVRALRVRDDLEGGAVHDGHAAVRGSQIDSEDFSHSDILSFVFYFFVDAFHLSNPDANLFRIFATL